LDSWTMANKPQSVNTERRAQSPIGWKFLIR
jgi:hypothetical protein